MVENNMLDDEPPNSSRDPKVGPKTKQWKKRIGAHFLSHSISGVGGHVRAPGWDYDKLTSENSR
jgi:hypothetical protein